MAAASFALAAPAGFAGTTTYTYDNLGRVTSVVTPSGAPIVYTYDGNGNRLNQAVSSGSNLPPVAIADSYSTSAGVQIHVQPMTNDSDPNNDSMNVTAVGSAGHGTTSIDTSQVGVYYTPNAGFTGTDSFTYTITDHHGGTASATITVTVS
jgi:YD repeat-containing protein